MVLACLLKKTQQPFHQFFIGCLRGRQTCGLKAQRAVLDAKRGDKAGSNETTGEPYKPLQLWGDKHGFLWGAQHLMKGVPRSNREWVGVEGASFLGC